MVDDRLKYGKLGVEKGITKANKHNSEY